jgi:protocatechuate 3,4-dioxygenase beta subunit
METGVVGDPLRLTGRVLTTDRIPLANVKLDFWQADGNGVYDNTGFRLRGHHFRDSEGGYALETVLPGLYPGRTRHIHLKVTAPGLSPLTTQIYFPDEPRNSSDGIFNARLLASVQKSAQMTNAQFDIVLEGTK